MTLRLPAGRFLGDDRRRRELDRLILVESSYATGQRQPRHAHANAYFDLVIGGGCVETIGGRSRERGPASLVFHPAGGEHASCWRGANARCFHIELAPALTEGLP